MHTRILTVLALIAMALAVRAAGNAATTTATYAPPTAAEADAAHKQGRYLAVITMEDGKKIEMVLEGQEMPYTVANFTKLAKAKYYDGTTFFQVVDRPGAGQGPDLKFYVGGDPEGTGTGTPGYMLRMEISPFMTHKQGSVSMFRNPQGPPNSAGSAFLILGTNLKSIDGQMAVFGWVKNGMNVLAGMKRGAKMKSVTVTPYNGKEANPLFIEAKLLKWKAPTKDEISAVTKQGRYLATITLTNGKQAEVVLEGKEAPAMVANFVKLAQAKFYNGLNIFHMERGPGMDMLQSGDQEGDGTGGPGYEIKYDKSKLLHKGGTLGMFRMETGGAGSQFYLTLSDAPQLDGQLSAFGWVKTGLEGLKAVKAGDKLKTITAVPYNGTEPNPLLPAPKVSKYQEPTAQEIAATKQQGRFLATVTMENGKQIELVLEGKEMPLTVANFVKLAQAKFYDGLTFHRVETNAGFQLIQGGDPQGNGGGDPGYSIKLEQPLTLIHKAGALAMARANDPDSAGCQFYITYCDIPNLDGNYAVFGWVKSGLDVVKEVKVGDKMKSIVVQPYDGQEPCPVAKPKGDGKAEEGK